MSKQIIKMHKLDSAGFCSHAFPMLWRNLHTLYTITLPAEEHEYHLTHFYLMILLINPSLLFIYVFILSKRTKYFKIITNSLIFLSVISAE